MLNEVDREDARHRAFIEKLLERSALLFQSAGEPNYEASIQQTIKSFEFLLNGMKTIQTKDDLRQALLKLPKPSAMEQRIFLAAIKYVPQLVNYGAKQIIQSEAHALPALPRGRPGSTLQQKAEIVGYVGALITKGCSTEIAKRRAATRFSRSESTIQRDWDDRGNMNEADFRSVLRWVQDGIGKR